MPVAHWDPGFAMCNVCYRDEQTKPSQRNSCFHVLPCSSPHVPGARALTVSYTCARRLPTLVEEGNFPL